MKNLSLICLVLLVCGCQKDPELINADTNQTTSFLKSNSPGDIITNELVIYYKDGITEQEKVVLRAESNVISFKKCTCADPNLELWTFETVTIDPDGDIEDKRNTANSKEDIENAEYSFKIDIPDSGFVSYSGSGNVNDALELVVSQSDGTTVAILDTGVDYNYEGFQNPFLYRSNPTCSASVDTDYFGWNFVDESNNPFDDYFGKHGTIVTHMITSQLEASNVDYQILPVKIANSNGRIHYFDALCGFQYAAGNSDVDIINMSFGWSSASEFILLNLFIEEVQDQILVITSAGNDSSDNDLTPHLPSSYENDNIVAVASLPYIPSIYDHDSGSGRDEFSLSEFSNYGQVSVDIAALGENIPFVWDGTQSLMSGTSFSTAKTTAMAASIALNGVSALTLKQQLISQCIYHPNLESIVYSSYVPN